MQHACIHTNFGGRGLSSFGDFAPFLFAFKMVKFSLRSMVYIVHGGQKIESVQSIYASRAIEVDVKCMSTKLFGYGQLFNTSYLCCHAHSEYFYIINKLAIEYVEEHLIIWKILF